VVEKKNNDTVDPIRFEFSTPGFIRANGSGRSGRRVWWQIRQCLKGLIKGRNKGILMGIKMMF
jgi:hypothetical protein